MKKNKTMRIAGVLLIAVLLTTSIISGTFAKYVTSDETQDSARVAMFGVVVTAEGKLFAESYVNVEDGNTPGDKPADKKADFAELTVETNSESGADESQLVAPGTNSGDGMTFSITGTPEVDVWINIEFDEDMMKDIFLSSTPELPDMTNNKNRSTFELPDDYYPLVFSVEGKFVENQWKAFKEYASDSVTFNKEDSKVSGTLTDIVNLLKAVFTENGVSENGIYVDANTDLSEEFGSFTLTWEWAFEGTQKLNDTKFNAKIVDKADTLLGDLMARDLEKFEYNETAKSEAFNALQADEENWDEGDYNLYVALGLSISVTQAD